MSAGGKTSLLFLAFWAGCSAGAPENPTWAADVRPIFEANCVRCHTTPSIGGAPRNFRLDVYEATVTDRGDVIYGARTVAFYASARVTEGTMPPRFPLNDRQKTTLENWDLTASGGAAPGNRLPSFELRQPLEESLGDGGRLTIAYEIDDPDFDAVIGTLVARPGGGGEEIEITRELHFGRGEAIWDVAAEAEGTYDLLALLRDGSEEVEREVGSFTVEHPDGNTAPRVTIRTTEDRSDLPLGPMQDVLIADGDSPFDVVVEITDPDAGGSLTLTLVAVRAGGAEEIVLADGVAAQPGDNIVSWDTTGVTESANWRLRATVREGDLERTRTTLPFLVGHRTTDRVFAGDIEEILGRCTICHRGEGSLPGMSHDFRFYGDNPDQEGTTLGVGDLAGSIYRRVVQQRTMPPPSGGVTPPISDAEREALADWLLAGAPEN